MNKALTEKIFREYEKYFKNRHDKRLSCMYFGFEHGDGWFDLVYNLMKQIDTVLKKTRIEINVIQVKEKFGGLRFYYDVRKRLSPCNKLGNFFRRLFNKDEKFFTDEDKMIDSVIEALVDNAENRSYHTCEKCGDTWTAKVRKGGWLHCLCDECSEGREPL